MQSYLLNFIFPILRHTVVSTVFICDAITNLIYPEIMGILRVTFWSKTFSAYLRSLVLGPLPLHGSDDVLVNGLFDATIFLIRTLSGRKSLVLSCGSRVEQARQRKTTAGVTWSAHITPLSSFYSDQASKPWDRKIYF